MVHTVSRLGGSASESLNCIPHVYDDVYSTFSYLLMSVQHFGQCEFFCIVLKQSKISLVALFPSFNISDQCGVKGLYLLHPLLSGHCDL